MANKSTHKIALTVLTKSCSYKHLQQPDYRSCVHEPYLHVYYKYERTYILYVFVMMEICECCPTSVFLTCSLCFLLSVRMSCTRSPLPVFEYKYKLLLQMTGGLLSLGQFTVFRRLFEQSHRGVLGESYLTLFYWSCLQQWWGGDSISYCSLSLSLPAQCHAAISGLCLCLLTSRGKAKELDVDSWGADSTETQGPLVGLVLVCVWTQFICDGAYAWHGPQ